MPSIKEKVLTVAKGLCDKLGQFNAEQLVVAAWQAHPDTFGLPGYIEQYPDSNRVLCWLMGKNGLVSHGWLVRLKEKVYGMTPLGIEQVNRAAKGSPIVCHVFKEEEIAARVQDKKDIALIGKLTVHAIMGGKPTFLDLTDLFGIGGLPAKQVPAKVKETEANIRRIAESALPVAAEARVILNCISSLKGKFARNLKMIGVGVGDD